MVLLHQRLCWGKEKHPAFLSLFGYYKECNERFPYACGKHHQGVPLVERGSSYGKLVRSRQYVLPKTIGHGRKVGIGI